MSVVGKRVVIIGAAGRDFHNFNVVYRGDPDVRVVAFTAAQIPGISGRRYPQSLAGPRYPEGVPIIEESELEALCRREAVDEVVFAYSDVPHETVMHAGSRALAVGADFTLLGPKRTMLRSRRPVIAITAVRTGCGKSQVSRWLSLRLRDKGLRAAALRHPMPYGDLAKQAVQRFATLEDLSSEHCTHEEREEYEPHIRSGNVVFAGVDYQAILEVAEAESDIVIWDGGNNDFPFLAPDLHIALADALRPDQIDSHHPGETVARMADVVVINKVDAAPEEDVVRLSGEIRRVNPAARIVRAASPVRLEAPEAVAGKRVLVIEDGPTMTHGGMGYGAGFRAAERAGAAAILDPRDFAAPGLQAVFETYPHIGQVLPAMGYGDAQLVELEATINASGADVVVAATPGDLDAVIKSKIPIVRARYDFAEAEDPGLGAVIDDFVERQRT